MEKEKNLKNQKKMIVVELPGSDCEGKTMASVAKKGSICFQGNNDDGDLINVYFNTDEKFFLIEYLYSKFSFFVTGTFQPLDEGKVVCTKEFQIIPNPELSEVQEWGPSSDTAEDAEDLWTIETTYDINNRNNITILAIDKEFKKLINA